MTDNPYETFERLGETPEDAKRRLALECRQAELERFDWSDFVFDVLCAIVGEQTADKLHNKWCLRVRDWWLDQLGIELCEPSSVAEFLKEFISDSFDFDEVLDDMDERLAEVSL